MSLISNNTGIAQDGDEHIKDGNRYEISRTADSLMHQAAAMHHSIQWRQKSIPVSQRLMVARSLINGLTVVQGQLQDIEAACALPATQHESCFRDRSGEPEDLQEVTASISSVQPPEPKSGSSQPAPSSGNGNKNETNTKTPQADDRLSAKRKSSLDENPQAKKKPRAKKARIDPSTNLPYTEEKLKAVLAPHHTPNHRHVGSHILIFRGPEKPDLPILCKDPKYHQTSNFIISRDALVNNSSRFKEVLELLENGGTFDEAAVWNPATSKTKKPFLKDLTLYFTGILQHYASKGDRLAEEILTFKPNQMFDVSLGTWFVFAQKGQFMPGSSPWEKERTLKIAQWIGATDEFIAKLRNAQTKAKHIEDNEEMDILAGRGPIIGRLHSGGYTDLGKRRN